SITNHGPFAGYISEDWQHAPIYVVVSDPTSSAQYNGGWNAPGFYSGPGGFLGDGPIHMIWVGTSTTAAGGVWKDGFTLTLSHELAETISDPANLMNVNPPSALPSSLLNPPGTLNQIGDFEPERYGYRLNGNLVQPYWSAQDLAFIVPDGNSQKFYLTP